MTDKIFDELTLYGNRLSERFNRIVERYFADKKVNVIIFIGILTAITIIMYTLNKHTTMIVDDYGYSFIWGKGLRVKSFMDIISSQYDHYFRWGGRSVVHFLAQAFLMYNKEIFNIANTGMYIILILLIYYHAVGSFKIYPSVLLIINLALVLFMPAFGQTFLWLVGACNYLWGPALVFLYLIIFRIQLTKQEDVIKSKVLSVLYGSWGIIAAWTNENMAVALVMMIIMFMLYYYHEKRRIPFWSKCALAGCFLGAVILLAAPGNYVRLGHFHNISYLRNFVNITKLFFAENYIFFPVFALVIICFAAGKRGSYKIPVIYLFGMVVSLYSMIGAPYFADRAKLGPLVFCLIAFCNLYVQFQVEDLQIKEIIIVTATIAGILMVQNYKIAYGDIISYEKRDKAKIEYALKEKQKGNIDIILPRNYPKTRFAAPYGLEDINKDPKHWTCTGFARYFGLHSVRTR